MLIALTIILSYLSVIALIAWVIEPCLRLRFGWYFIKPDPKFYSIYGDGDPNREVFGALILAFWPIGIPLFFVIKYGLIYLIMYIYRSIKFINKASEQFWTPKPKVVPERIIDETKTNYRNFAFIEKDKV